MFDRVHEHPKLFNQFVLLIDFQKGPINSELIKKVIALNYEHYPNIIKKILIINIVIDVEDKKFQEMGRLVKAVNDNLFVIMDHNYKQNIGNYVKSDLFLKGYGGVKEYKNSYNFCSKELSFDFFKE